MTKQILIPSVLLFTAACTTSGDYAGDALLLDGPSAKSIGEALPVGPEILIQNVQEDLLPEVGLVIEEMVDTIVNMTASDKANEVLAMRSYVLPLGPGAEQEADPMVGHCGVAPEFDSLQVLDSACDAVDNHWGWEIEVEDCEVDGEMFSGVMQITYKELNDLPAFLPQGFVMDEAQSALSNNGSGSASLRYALDVASPLSVVESCGEEFGPDGFRFVERDTHRFSTVEHSLERISVQGMRHALGGETAAEGRILTNRDGAMEISSPSGERVRVNFLTVGVASQEGDLWPTAGAIESHIEGMGSVGLRFSPQTAIDGTVEVVTPLGTRIAVLPMD